MHHAASSRMHLLPLALPVLLLALLLSQCAHITLAQSAATVAYNPLGGSQPQAQTQPQTQVAPTGVQPAPQPTPAGSLSAALGTLTGKPAGVSAGGAAPVVPAAGAVPTTSASAAVPAAVPAVGAVPTTMPAATATQEPGSDLPPMLQDAFHVAVVRQH